uniref:Solute carrier family 38 member 8a n=1 Tax=Takifugu rubripes TaxID=31033 RepID=H2SFG2_TAKRU
KFCSRVSVEHAGPRLGSLGAIFILLKSALGAGLLNFPWAFAKAGGIHNAVTVELASLVFLVSGLVILGYSSSVSGRCTYQAVVREMCGLAIGHLCEICFIFNLFMISVAFLVIMDDQLGKRELTSRSIPSRNLSACSPLLHDTLESTSRVIDQMSLLLASLVLEFALFVLQMTFECAPVCRMSSWASTFTVIPTICFGFQCHEASITIYSNMENQRLSHWILVCVISMIVCLIIYSLTGVYGYLTFGKEVKADVLMSYSSDDVVMIIARLLFAVSLVTIYPIVLLLGRSVIQDHLLRRWRPCAGVSALESRSRYVVTVLWITVTLLFAIFVPDISKIISVIGGISAFFIFIFPGLCLMFAMHGFCVPRVILTLWGAFTLVCGAFIFGQSTTITVMQILGKI